MSSECGVYVPPGRRARDSSAGGSSGGSRGSGGVRRAAADRQPWISARISSSSNNSSSATCFSPLGSSSSTWVAPEDLSDSVSTLSDASTHAVRIQPTWHFLERQHQRLILDPEVQATRKYSCRARERANGVSFMGNRATLVTVNGRRDTLYKTAYPSPCALAWRWLDDAQLRRPGYEPYCGLAAPLQVETKCGSESDVVLVNTCGTGIVELRVNRQRGVLAFGCGSSRAFSSGAGKAWRAHLAGEGLDADGATRDPPAEQGSGGADSDFSDAAYTYDVAEVRISLRPASIEVLPAVLRVPSQPSVKLPGRFMQWDQLGENAVLVEIELEEHRNEATLKTVMDDLRDVAQQMEGLISHPSTVKALGPLTGIWEVSCRVGKNQGYNTRVLIVHVPGGAKDCNAATSDPFSGPVLVLVYSAADEGDTDWWISCGQGYVGPSATPTPPGMADAPSTSNASSRRYEVCVRRHEWKRDSHGERLVYSPAREDVMYTFEASPTGGACIDAIRSKSAIYTRCTGRSEMSVEEGATVSVDPTAPLARCDPWFAACLGNSAFFRNIVLPQPSNEQQSNIRHWINHHSELGDLAPLLLASRHGHLDVVKALYDLRRLGANMHIKRHEKDSTALGWAAVHRHWHVVRYLLGTVGLPLDDNTTSKFDPPRWRETPEEKERRERDLRTLVDINDDVRGRTAARLGLAATATPR